MQKNSKSNSSDKLLFLSSISSSKRSFNFCKSQKHHLRKYNNCILFSKLEGAAFIDTFFYKKSNSKPSSKSFLTLSHILALQNTKNNKQSITNSIAKKMGQCELKSKQCHIHIVSVQPYVEPNNGLKCPICLKLLSPFLVVLEASQVS